MKAITSFLFCLLLLSCKTQSFTLTFQLDMTSQTDFQTVGIRGNIAPLSWDEDYPLTDPEGDGIYEATIDFKTSKKSVQYKFRTDTQSELAGSDNRIRWFSSPNPTKPQRFNEFDYYSQDELAALTFTPAQIEEDVRILRKTLQYIHPNLYKYRDSLQLEKDFQVLKAQMLASPDLLTAYKALSQFATRIKCSHTFTNPWNQSTQIKKAIFYQPDKLPFSFQRIGKRLFLDKNASQDTSLDKGLEILRINGVSSEEVMTRLAKYITSDGDNYEKRLQRLTLSGAEKFELFDIFYPLEFGSPSLFQLTLKDHTSGSVFETQVDALSKTARTAILQERYQNLSTQYEDRWQFKIINAETAHLKIQSFANYNSDFKWQKFLADAFQTLNEKSIQHLIIDIRDNEGGNDEIAKYILERIITQPITIETPAPYTVYRQVPEELRPHISTWEKRPYDWGNKVQAIDNGRFVLKTQSAKRQTKYSPKSGGFKGKSYLLTNAENSSATHIMATYVKRYKLATIVGQETGGNQKGLNGNHYFFHRLPNTRVEIDIPLFGINILPDTPETPNSGIIPDVIVEKNSSDLINGIDTEMNAVLDWIKNTQK